MDFKQAMTEWVALKAQLAAARKDLSVLNGREKDLRKFVTRHMKEQEIDTVKVQDKVKVNFKTKKTKGPLTKDVIKKGLSTFFGGNEAQIEGAFQAILDAAPIKETDGVMVTGLKAILEA
jgi:UDP-N-acetylmuramoylalanine-D-glutamate ligase